MNTELAKIFHELSVFTDMKDVPFKPQAFEKAAHSIEIMKEDVSGIYSKGGSEALENIPGIGSGIAERIEEYIETGHIKEYEKFKKQIPVDIEGLSAIEGIGPKLIFKLYKKLDIKTVSQLKKAAEKGKLHNLSGLGNKTERNILRNIQFLEKGHGRFLLGFILPTAQSIIERIRSMPGVYKAEFAGSVRRMQETIGDLDILVVSKDPEHVMDFFVSMSYVKSVYGKGSTKSSVRLKIGIDADLRVVPPKSFGAALQYFTGDKYHNVQLRKVAIRKGYKLNEYGFIKETDWLQAKRKRRFMESWVLRGCLPNYVPIAESLMLLIYMFKIRLKSFLAS